MLWAGALGKWVSTAAFHAGVRGSVPGLGGLKETKMFLPHTRVKLSIVGSLRDQEVACSASDRQGSNFESCVWRTVSSHSSHHPQEVLLAQFSLYGHKGGLKPDSFIYLCYGSTVIIFFYFFDIRRQNMTSIDVRVCPRILVQATIYRRLLIGRDGHLDQSEAYDILQLVREYGQSHLKTIRVPKRLKYMAHLKCSDSDHLNFLWISLQKLG